MTTTHIEGFSASSHQKRLWRLLRERGPFRSVALLAIEGPWQDILLERSLHALAKRHQILRTAFVVPAGLTQPHQVISEEARVRILRQDTLPDEVAAGVVPAREAALPVETDGVLVPRVTIFPAIGARRLLLLNIPAICCDGWSLRQLPRDLAEIYQNLSQGEEEEEEPVQYVAYSEWLEEIEAEGEAALAFWLDRQAEVVAGDPLKRFQHEHGKTFQPDRLRLPDWDPGPFSGQGTGALGDARVFWLSCWFLLLSRFAHLSRLSVATGFDGRSFEELETSCGPFIRYLPLTVDIAEALAFQELSACIAAEAERLEKRQDFFDGHAQPREYLPAFEWEEGETVCEEGPLTIRLLDEIHWEEPFGLKLHMAFCGRSYQPTLYFDGGRFDRAFMERLGAHLLILARAAATRPRAPIGSLPSLPRAERALLLDSLNHSQAMDTRPRPPVHRLFEARVRKHPATIALVFDPGSSGSLEQYLDLAALNREANRWSHFLRGRGAGPERPVAICLERCTGLITAMLAALKSGGGYIPLDANLPPRRIAAMVSGSGSALLLTHRVGLHEEVDLPVIAMDRERIAHEPDENLAENVVRLEPANLAYGIFTSGSTGSPKAVGVEHRNLSFYLERMRPALNLEREDSYAVVSTLAADLGNTVVYGALCHGGTLHLLSEEHISDALAFASYLETHPIDCLKITPSHLATLMTGSQRVLPRKRLILGGETTPTTLLQRIRGAAPGLEIFNHYGPSETTIGILTHRDRPEITGFPLGRPLAGARIYLLNTQLEPVPRGAPGEIFLAGPGVTRGYLLRPELSAARFLPHPFSAESGGRVYRTGDRGLFSDGDGEDPGLIHFLDRVDRQIKLRGFRIEPGEIESCLRQHAGVRDAVVIPHGETPGGERLVAYVETLERQGMDPAEAHTLQRFLLDRLADYMVPPVYVLMEHLPLNANGKIDHRALPVPASGASNQAAYSAPRTDSEHILVQVWQELLSIERIGIDDHFFELGGHSFLAIRTMAELKQRLGLKLEVRTLLENPGLRDFAAIVERAREGSTTAENTLDGREWLSRHEGELVMRATDPDGAVLRIWFTELDQDRVRALIRDGCPPALVPHYVRSLPLLAQFDALPPGGAAREPLLALLGLSAGPASPQEASALFTDGVRQARARLNQTFAAGKTRSSYNGGHHPAWFIRREVRSINFGGFEGNNCLDEARVLAHINRLIASQSLLRAILTSQEDDFCFVEVEELLLKELTVFDFSSYLPETGEKCLTGLKYAMWEELYGDNPPLDTVLYNIVLVKLDVSRYQILMALDHIIADYEVKQVLARFFECLGRNGNAERAADETHAASLAASPFSEFARIMTAPSDGDREYGRLKKDPVYRSFQKPVARLQEKLVVGEPIVYSGPYLLEAWPEPSGGEDAESNFLGHGLAAAVGIVSFLFDLNEVPLRVLVSRRYFQGLNFYNAIGDFHDSVPVLFSAAMTDAGDCFAKLQETDRYFGSAGLNISSVGGDPEIYRNYYKCPFSFNFVGEIPPREEARTILGAGAIKFLVYPFYAYHVGAKLSLIINHGLTKDMEMRLRRHLGDHYKIWRLRSLDETIKAEIIETIERLGYQPEPEER